MPAQQSGFITITGLAFLEKARRASSDPNKALSLAFDAFVRLEDAVNSDAPGFALTYLTYFNADGLTFSTDPTPYFITAKVRLLYFAAPWRI